MENDRKPAPFWWPTERGFVTLGLFAFSVLLVLLAAANAELWRNEAYKIITQAVIITGLLNLIGGFHFAANKEERDSAAKRVDNTAAAFKAIEATANATAAPGDPKPVRVVNDQRDPVPVDDRTKDAPPDPSLAGIDGGELPESDKL